MLIIAFYVGHTWDVVADDDIGGIGEEQYPLNAEFVAVDDNIFSSSLKLLNWSMFVHKKTKQIFIQKIYVLH